MNAYIKPASAASSPVLGWHDGRYCHDNVLNSDQVTNFEVPDQHWPSSYAVWSGKYLPLPRPRYVGSVEYLTKTATGVVPSPSKP
jgi:hypothetical protein